MKDPSTKSRYILEAFNRHEALMQSMRKALDPYFSRQREIEEQIAIFTSNREASLRRMQGALDETRNRPLINVDMLRQIDQATRAAYARSQQVQKSVQETIAQQLRINEALGESLRRWQEEQQRHWSVSLRELNRPQEFFRELNNLTRNVPPEDLSESGWEVLQ